MSSEIDMPRIDWATAQARRGTVTVSLSGAPPRGWRAHFGAVVDLLQPRAQAWGKVRLRKHGVIAVKDVHPGCEQDLRTLLEGAVMQANSHLQPDGASSNGLPASVAPPSDDPRVQADRAITRALREFAAEH